PTPTPFPYTTLFRSLAVSYVTASGTDSIGTIPVDASRDTAKVDTLRLVYDPKPAVNAASPTFRFEIRSAYRVGGREIDRTSVDLDRKSTRLNSSHEW